MAGGLRLNIPGCKYGFSMEYSSRLALAIGTISIAVGDIPSIATFLLLAGVLLVVVIDLNSEELLTADALANSRSFLAGVSIKRLKILPAK